MPRSGAYLAGNIRVCRKARGLTQGELARELGLTAQTVSKWETGMAVPDLNNLCALASALQVTADWLLQERAGEAFVAIDGGGSKTEFLLLNESGRVLNRLVLEGSNPNAIGLSAAGELLCRGIRSVLGPGIRLKGIFAGVAGSATGENGTALIHALEGAFPGVPSRVEPDIVNVIHAAPEVERCIAVICGTGSVAFGWDGEALLRAGGWGYLFDGAGGGFDLGRDALTHTLRQETGLCAPSTLSRLVQEEAKGEILPQLDRIYARGNGYIASFAPLVMEAYDQGDPAAEEILQRGMDHIRELVQHLKKQGNFGKKLLLAGGLTRNQKVFQNLLLPLLEEGTELIFPKYPPIFGACRRYMACFGPKEYDEEAFATAFLESYQTAKEEQEFSREGTV